MMQELIIIALLVYIFAREAVFLYSTHKLVNKLMAKNYYDYKVSENVGNKKETVQKPFDVEELPEDLRALAGIG